jgi:hypothetical protein
MSSPPTSNTSTKAAHLHNDHRNPSAFPQFAALNPFRKKSLHKPAKSPSPVEPYEVAPGIWNTDATAKVFGYLEPEVDKGKPRSLVAGTEKRFESLIPARKPVAQRDTLNLDNSTWNDDSANNNHPRLPRLSLQIPHPTGKNDVINVGEKYRRKAERERMRTVSGDDRLIQRGANPRTGLVSPLIVSDSSDDNVGHGCVSLGKTPSERPLPKGRSRSGKWRQDCVGWSLVESPLLSPIAQSSADPISRRVSCKRLEDKLLVEMPGVDNPEPENMTDQQMRRYQESVARACGHAGTNAMVDPNTAPPSPRPLTPEGPSTPPNKLRRIRRKMVGSGPSRKDNSYDTAIVVEKQAFPMPTSRKRSNDMQTRAMPTPSNTPRGSSRSPHSDTNLNPTENPFLGQKIRRQPGQTESGTHFPPLRTAPRHDAHRLSPVARQRPSGARSVEPPATPTLSQYLPRLQFLHPSHFANLETSTYRRPAQLLPARLRPVEEKRKNIEDACTITTTSTLGRKAQKEQVPKVQSQDASNVVTRPNQCNQSEHGMTKGSLLQEGISTNQRSSAIKLTVDTSEPITARHTIPIPVAQMQDFATPERKARAIGSGATFGARAAVLGDYRSQQVKDCQTRKCSGAIPTMQGLSLGSANIIRDPIQNIEKNGAGITHTSGPLGDHLAGRSWGCRSPGQKQMVEVPCRVARKSSEPREMAFNRDGGLGFAYRSVDPPQNQRGISSKRNEFQEQSQSVFRKTEEVRLWLQSLTESLQASGKLQCVQQCLHQMARHIIQTMHPRSAVMTTLRTPNVRAYDFLLAAKDLILACIYLLVLLSILMALKKVLVLPSLVICWIWHSARIILAVVKWCVLA